MKTHRFAQHWKNKTPPPSDDPGAYNSTLTFEVMDPNQEPPRTVAISGVVVWSSSVREYTFQYMELSKHSHLYEAATLRVSATELLYIKFVFRQVFGIKTTIGLVDEDQIRLASSYGRTVLQ